MPSAGGVAAAAVAATTTCCRRRAAARKRLSGHATASPGACSGRDADCGVVVVVVLRKGRQRGDLGRRLSSGVGGNSLLLLLLSC